MLKKTINCTNYNGEQKTKECYFNLSKAEIAEMELEIPGGMAANLKQITEAKDTPSLVKIFKNLILRSYGVKSSDGERFIKNQQVREEFEQSEAYSELFMELATNADSAAEFVNGIIPADLANKVKELENK